MGTTNKEKDGTVFLGDISPSISCLKCSKVLSGQLEIDNHHCFGNSEPKGWICPKCGSGVSPDTSICPCAEPLGISPWDNGDNQQHCLHDQCIACAGTGIRKGGGACVHHLSCPCPKCSPTY